MRNRVFRKQQLVLVLQLLNLMTLMGMHLSPLQSGKSYKNCAIQLTHHILWIRKYKNV